MAAGPPARISQPDLHHAILGALGGSSEPLTTRAIFERLAPNLEGLYLSRVGQVLESLVRAGGVELDIRAGPGRGNRVRWWSIRPPTAPRAPAKDQRPPPAPGKAGPQLRPDFLANFPGWA